MPSNHPVRTALIVIIGCILLVFLYFASPFIWYEFQIHHWEHQIRDHQDPEELRAWAINLITIYSSTNSQDMMAGRITNRPPSGIPISGRFPRVVIGYDQLSETTHGPYHVGLLWGSGFLPMWGMDIGDTNFVCRHEKKTEWKPGIYFFLEP